MSMKSMASLLIVGMVATPIFAQDKSSAERERLQRAEALLKASLDARDRGVPKDALEKAECVGVFPDVKKAAFFVGGDGKDATAKSILIDHAVGPPQDATAFLKTLNAGSGRS